MNILSIIIAVLLALSAALSVSAHQFIRNRVIAAGRVSDLVASRGSKGGTVYKVVAEFTDRTGGSHVYRGSISSSSPGYKIGDPIRICYKADEPTDCGVYSFGYRFGTAWAVFAIAVALGLFALGDRYGQGLMDSIYLGQPDTMELR